MIIFADWLVRFPGPHRRRYEEARAKLDDQIYRIIRQRRESGEQCDLLSMILAAREGGVTRTHSRASKRCATRR